MTSNPRIKDMALHDRPRERLVAEGAEGLDNVALVAILLRTGTRGYSALDIAGQLLARFQTLENLARASLTELRQMKGVGRDKAVTLKAAFQLACNMARELRHEAPLLDTPERVAELLRGENRTYQVETFQALLLNTRRRLLRVEKISQGTLDTLLVHPREVFKPAILESAASIILLHNHPSGDPTPSREDLRLTRQLVECSKLLDLRIHDHVIIGRERFISLAQQGAL